LTSDAKAKPVASEKASRDVLSRDFVFIVNSYLFLNKRFAKSVPKI
jgi:hypothetical protein